MTTVPHFVWTDDDQYYEDVLNSNNDPTVPSDPNQELLTNDQKLNEILRLLRGIASGSTMSGAQVEVFESSIFPIRSIDAYFAFIEQLHDNNQFRYETVSKIEVCFQHIFSILSYICFTKAWSMLIVLNRVELAEIRESIG